MGLNGSLLKNVIVKSVSGGLGLAIIHAIVFWTAYFQCGGSHNSIKGIWQGLKTHGSAWASILKWTGMPLSCIDVSGPAMVVLMILNSLLWGAVLGILIGLVFGRRR